MNTKARLIAFYLPQFHPIPENNLWWGEGFTEWTNVAKARPLFKGHYQPHLPADLGFYDLRVRETRLHQAELAMRYGIEGFCYWHYWFAGRRILERPFTEVLDSRQPDFPFCLAWANQTWSGIWHGSPNRILIEQTYPGIDDYEKHFYALLPAFSDPRYMNVGGRKIFIVYNLRNFPGLGDFIACWRKLASKNGLGGLYLVGVKDAPWNKEPQGFDAFTNNFTVQLLERRQNKIVRRGRDFLNRLKRRPSVYSYESFIDTIFPQETRKKNYLPCVIPNWDNTPRSGSRGVVLHNATPELYQRHLREALDIVDEKQADEKIVFVKSWNEWAEGNYLEPDQRWGHRYLETTAEAIHIS
jgi:lipopolysaccharide biosynthesis protein